MPTPLEPMRLRRRFVVQPILRRRFVVQLMPTPPGAAALWCGVAPLPMTVHPSTLQPVDRDQHEMIRHPSFPPQHHHTMAVEPEPAYVLDYPTLDSAVAWADNNPMVVAESTPIACAVASTASDAYASTAVACAVASTDSYASAAASPAASEQRLA